MIRFIIRTGRITDMVNITTEIQRQVTSTGVKDGLVTVYVPHTTAAITINEGADPAVLEDIGDTMNELVPWERVYGHAEGNSPAHIKTSLFGASVTLSFRRGPDSTRTMATSLPVRV